MQSIRITEADGTVRLRDLDVRLLNIGRSRTNDLVLDDAAVSGEHCVLEYDGAGGYVIKDRGSANGTFINNGPVHEPTRLLEGDRLYVGPFLIELVSLAPELVGRKTALGPSGPIIRPRSNTSQAHRDFERVLRWAMEWDREGRPKRLLSQGAPLDNAIRALGRPDSLMKTSELVLVFLAKSRSAQTRSTVVRIATILGVLAVIGGAAGFGYRRWVEHRTTQAPQEEAEAAVPEVAQPVSSDLPTPARDTWVDHTVVPAETLEDIARRYDVPIANVARWNRLNPDEPGISPGQVLRVKPKKNPLPQQQIVFDLDKDYNWRALSERFGVPVARLRAYNPDATLAKGQRITVWFDPKPYPPRSELLNIPEFQIRDDARSMGRPNDGRLEKGIQMPRSDLYTRRAPFIMFGSSHTIKTLQTAIAHFRQEVNFDGVLVLADISRKKGGNFYPPHKSHQAGRDIDIWMPTLKGVYKESYLGKERKPKPNEIDWFATWGLVRALIDTDEVVHIFLTHYLQEKLYEAAKLMGATDEELSHAMQWPRGPGAPGVVGHSPGHTGHIHVRFKCGPSDTQCINDVSRVP